MEHRGGEAKESGPCSIGVSLNRYLSFKKSKLQTLSPSVCSGKGLPGGRAAWWSGQSPTHGAVRSVRTGQGTGSCAGDARALPAPTERTPAPEPAGTAAERWPWATQLLLWSSPGHALLQHQHLFQSWRVSPHQGTFREQSTWSRASASPKVSSQSVPPAQEPLQCCQFYLTVHFNSTSCLPGLDEGKLYFSAAPVSTALPRALLGRI